jgi:transposase
MFIARIRGPDHHRYARPRAALAGNRAAAATATTPLRRPTPVSMIVPRWPGSSTSCALASPGGCCRSASLAAAARSPAGGGCGTGNAPGCGSSSTTCCWASSAVSASWTGRRASLDSISVRAKRGGAEGPNPVDRGKPGSTCHLLVDRHGIPLAVGLSAANTYDSVLLAAMVDAAPPVKGPRGRPGRPRRRPAKLHLDKGDDDPRCRGALRRRGITPRVAGRGIESSARLGRHRWVIERSLAWLVGCRRIFRSATTGMPTSCSHSSISPAR